MLMRNLRTRIRLLMLCGIVSIVLLISSTAIGQTTDIAPIFQPTPNVRSVDDQLRQALERLDKSLDAYEKATKALNFALDEIEARKRLDSLKDQIIAVKDIIIANQDELIKRLRKPEKGFIARLKQILAIAEKVALIALGGAIGRGL